MGNTSATGGYLKPTNPNPTDDLELDIFFQNLISGLSDLLPQLIMPRWQPGNPKMPEHNVNWCAVGTTVTDHDFDPCIIHDPMNPDGPGQDVLTREEEITVFLSFYGPQGFEFGKQVRDGLNISQNLDIIASHGLKFSHTAQPLRALHELINKYWYRRYDTKLVFRRRVVRTYAILNLESAKVEVIPSEGPKSIIIVEE